MRILFVNHTGRCSGAENAMLRLLESLSDDHARAVACPLDGGLKEAVLARGVPQFDLMGTELSFSLHPVRTPLAFARLVQSALSIVRCARHFRADVVHANSVRAGLIAGLARSLGGPPMVTQVHDHLPPGRQGDLTRLAIAAAARNVVGVTDATAARFNEGLRRPKAERVYISIDHARFSPRVRGQSRIRSELGLEDDTPLLIHVAQITPWKGQDIAIRALAQVRREVDAHLLIVGEVAFESQRYDNQGFHSSLKLLARELDVRNSVHFLGYRLDTPELMGAAQLLLLPSWDEPFGLVVAEAMACGTPPLVTERGGVGEYVCDGVNGRLLPPDAPEAWADAALRLLGDHDARAGMGGAAAQSVARFTDARYAEEMLAVYRNAIRGT